MGAVVVNIVLVYNQKSGTALPLETLRAHCASHDITITHAVDISANFPASLTPHITPGARIAAYGGDGTQNAVAQQLHNTDAIMVPLPGGTLNNFTKDLGIPQDIDAALARLATLSPRSVDVGIVNDQVFVNNSSIGFYPSSLRVRSAVGAHIGKWPAAALGMLHALIKFKLYTVTMEGHTFQTPFIFIGNNDYPLDKAGSRPSLTAGKLCAYAIAAPTRRTLVKLAFSALYGKLAEQDEFIVHCDSTISIHTRRKHVTVSADGEVTRVSSPLTYRSLALSLKVLG